MPGFALKYFNKTISSGPVLDLDAYFPQASQFIDNWEEIRNEAYMLTEKLSEVPRFHELLESQTRISTEGKGDWRVFIPRAYGVDIDSNMKKCPTLAKLLRRNKNVISANISIIDPQKIIPLHRGPFKGILRFSLGLSVPQNSEGHPGVILILDGKDYRIGDGEYLLWDDTYEHGVKNETDKHRIVLLLDVYRPNMPVNLRLLSRLFIFLAKMTIKRKVNIW